MSSATHYRVEAWSYSEALHAIQLLCLVRSKLLGKAVEHSLFARVRHYTGSVAADSSINEALPMVVMRRDRSRSASLSMLALRAAWPVNSLRD